MVTVEHLTANFKIFSVTHRTNFSNLGYSSEMVLGILAGKRCIIGNNDVII
jgi:hypothetical protein